MYNFKHADVHASGARVACNIRYTNTAPPRVGGILVWLDIDIFGMHDTKGVNMLPSYQ